MTQRDVVQEPILEPDLPIIDPHHHLWDRPGSRYLLDEFLQDVNTGHNIVATVFVQCRAMYRTSGPDEMRAIGETEFANGIAAMSESGRYGPTRVCAAIVTHADLTLGAAVQPVLEEHMRVSGGRFRGIRHILAWDEDAHLRLPGYEVWPHMAANPRFQDGLACLGKLGLSFEAFQLHPQLPDVIALARRNPALRIVLNHVGTPTRIGPYKGREHEVFETWRTSIRELAQCPNVTVKLGGLSVHWVGLPFDAARSQASSQELAAAWRPFVETCIEAFGVQRCMFESNFPPDRAGTNYPTLWNAFKRIVGAASASEKDQLFRGTAATVYRIGPQATGGVARTGMADRVLAGPG